MNKRPGHALALSGRWLLLFAFVLSLSLTSFGQQPAALKIPRGKTFSYRPDGKESSASGRASSSVHEVVQLSADNLRLSKSSKPDRYGFENKKYQQFYKGIPLEHGWVTSSVKNGKLVSVAGEIYDVPASISTSPSISESAALDAAMLRVGGKKYKWQDEQNPGTPPKGKLVFVNTYTQHGVRNADEIVLAWKFDIYAVKPLARKEVFVNAATGAVVYENSLIRHAQEGQAQTRFSGMKTISTTFDNNLGKYVLKDDSRGDGVETYNLNRTPNYATATLFTDADNSWTEFDNQAKDNVALDAHWGAMMTYDYFKQEHGRNSYDDNGAKIKSYVHFDVNFVNAFWDGNVMTYGDGDSNVNPLTSLDICAHEIGHAVCEHTANLVYYAESGALNEGLSDIWGATIEHFAAPEKSPWDMGEDINWIIRSLSDPNQHQQPDTYLGDMWYLGYADGGGVHTNSGVINHWYYILVEGKSGVNDHGTAYAVQGLGFDAAAAIVYRMESVYLTANAQYKDARNAAIQAALDIYGNGSNEVIQTRRAWDAVGVYDMDAAPSQLIATVVSSSSVRLYWTDKSTNESSFIIERSVAGPASGFTELSVEAANTVTYLDEGLQPGLYYYRVRARVEDYATGNSNVAGIPLGSTPLTMKNGEVTTCDKIFLDPGGLNNYTYNQNITMVVKPAQVDKKVSIRFSAFSTVVGDNVVNEDDQLEVFDGNTVSAPRIGVYTGSTLPAQINATNASGVLTFRFTSGSYDESSGWHAHLGCVTIPSDLVATPSGTQVNLAWQDNPTDETGYSIERKAIGNTSFKEIATMPANTASYVDAGLPADNTYEYRVIAQSSGQHAAHSSIATATIGREPFVMREGNFSVCNVPFFDPGGNGPYFVAKFGDIYTSITTTLSPSAPGTKVSIAFSEFDIEQDFEFLSIYDGADSNAPLLLDFITGKTLPERVTASNAEGKLTLEFWTDESYTYSGWKGEISCIVPPATPGNLVAQTVNDTQIHLTWQDNTADETGFVIERATGTQFTVIDSVGVNVQSYDDVGLATNKKYTYRIRSIKGDIASFYSNTASAVVGTEPLLMQNGTFVACNTRFTDSGGEEGVPGTSENFVLTLRPDAPGKKVRVQFSSFDLDRSFETLAIYDGPTVQSPAIGFFTSTVIDPEISATNADGSLTFRFTSPSFNPGTTGWEAFVTCTSPPAAPGNLVAQLDGDHVNLTWEDNSGDETGFVVERATGTTFVELTTTGTDVESFVDTHLPDNRTLTYRIRAKHDDVFSLPSNTAAVAVGDVPVIMRQATVGAINTCHGEFLDPGGDEDYGTADMRMTIGPDAPGKKVVLTFTEVDVEDDLLRVCNGNSIDLSNELKDFRSAYALPVSLQAANSQGTLTVQLSTWNAGHRGSGWKATISCVSKGALTVDFPDKTVKYSDPEDGTIFVGANARVPYSLTPFIYSIVNDPSSTGQATTNTTFGGIIVRVTKPGIIKIRASLPETANYLAVEKTMTLTVTKGTWPINLTDYQIIDPGNSPYELKATVGLSKRAADFTFQELPPPNGSYTGDITLSGEGGRMVTPVAAGYLKIRATLPETDVYQFTEVIRTLEVRRATPAITFSGMTASVGDVPVNLNATAFEGAPFIYGVEGENTGTVSLSGTGNKTLTPLSPGAITVRAFLPETQLYYSGEKTATITIVSSSGTAAQSITFAPLTAKTYGESAFRLTATVSSSLPIAYHSANPAVASISGNNMLTINGAGSVIITATQLGNGTYAPATPVQRTLTVNKKNLVADILATRAYGDPNPPFVTSYQGFVNGDDENDLDVKPSGATTTATETSTPGDYAITFTALGSDNNYALTQGEGILTITKRQQQITFDAPEDVLNSVTSVTLSASANSGLPVTYRIVSGPATVSGDVITLTGHTGVVQVEASQPGDANYQAADVQIRSFKVELDPLMGIEDPGAGSIELWPNPASSAVIIKSAKNTIAKISIVDMIGRSTDHEAGHVNEYRVETRAMNSGVYTVSIGLDNGEVVFKRLVVK